MPSDADMPLSSLRSATQASMSTSICSVKSGSWPWTRPCAGPPPAACASARSWSSRPWRSSRPQGRRGTGGARQAPAPRAASRGGAAGAGVAAGAPGVRRAWPARRGATSALTIRPPGPLPVTRCRSTPFSRAIRLARGEALTRSPSDGDIAMVCAGPAEGTGRRRAGCACRPRRSDRLAPQRRASLSCSSALPAGAAPAPAHPCDDRADSRVVPTSATISSTPARSDS